MVVLGIDCVESPAGAITGVDAKSSDSPFVVPPRSESSCGGRSALSSGFVSTVPSRVGSIAGNMSIGSGSEALESWLSPSSVVVGSKSWSMDSSPEYSRVDWDAGEVPSGEVAIPGLFASCSWLLADSCSWFNSPWSPPCVFVAGC